MPLLVPEQEIAQLQAQLKERAQKALSIPLDEAATEIREKVRATRGLRLRHEFSTADGDDDDEHDRWSGKHTVKSAVHELVVKRKPENEAIERFQNLNDSLIIMAALWSDLRKNRKPTVEDFSGFRDYREYCKVGQYLLNTEYKGTGLNTSSATFGAEFIPTNFSNQLIDKWRLELLVPALFQRVTMPTKVYKLPLESTDSIGFLIPEATDDRLYDNTNNPFINADQPKTANITFTAVKLATRTVWSEEATEDSIINIIDYARRKIAQALANADEDADINGDTTGPHQDNDVTDARDRRKAWKGLRVLTNAGAEVDFLNGDANWESLMRSVRLKMGKYGARPSQLAWIVSPRTAIKLTANLPSYQTLDKLGPSAVVLTGQVGQFDGSPVITSEFVREDLDVAGHKSGGASDRTVMLLVNKTQFLHGDRSMMTLRSYEHELTDQQYAIAKHRLDFQTVEGSGSNNVVGQAINVKTT